MLSGIGFLFYRRRLKAPACVLPVALALSAASAETEDGGRYQAAIRPLLESYCFDCHAGGSKRGGVAFDAFPTEAELLRDRDLWHRVLKNVRAGLMPPPGEMRPSPAERRELERWIKAAPLGLDPARPDPGKVTLRRLNRFEYRNTVRDLLGVEFKVEEEFPADDSGHGFDNLGEVLTVSPMLLERYLAAARAIVAQAVPLVSHVVRERRIAPDRFERLEPVSSDSSKARSEQGPASVLSYYEAATAVADLELDQPGRYTIVLDLSANERFVEGENDLNKCRAVFSIGTTELKRQEFTREPGRSFRFEAEQELPAGRHQLSLAVEPLTPGEKQVRSLSLRINSAVVRGPHDEKHWVRSEAHARFFPREIPGDPEGRRAYAREILGSFVARAFRRPVDEGTVDRLVRLAEIVYAPPSGERFEAGIARAMEAVLASPRFLFRQEKTEPLEPGQDHPFVDDYTLASRLSYFLWSSMPDEELLKLAAEKKLRASLLDQARRLLKDRRSEAFIQSFTGQWLQARDVETVPIDGRVVAQRDAAPDPEIDNARRRFRELRNKEPEQLTPEEKAELEKARGVFSRSFGRFRNVELGRQLRQDMRRETEKYFEFVVREDRSLLELIDSDYTFLNNRLAEHYGIPGIEGEELRRVTLPSESPRGGVLTQGSVLVVTSNPTRTSPVKRGLFILENILGTPPPPPPPNIPALEDAARGREGELTLRETLAIHRQEAACKSCHNRMDPLGLAFESFNAMGRWRDQERGKPIDPAGQLVSGEAFSGVGELKRILAEDHRSTFLRCVTEKMLIYALGRAIDYRDETTIDAICERLERSEGRASALIEGIIESAAFQKQRRTGGPEPAAPTPAGDPREEVRRF